MNLSVFRGPLFLNFSFTFFSIFAGRATNIAYIGPSLTSYWDLNPGYRIYYIDGDYNGSTRMVVDHETWILNLEEANILNNPIWRKSYSAKHAYSMQGLRPIDWDDLIKRMQNDDDLFDLYFRY